MPWRTGLAGAVLMIPAWVSAIGATQDPPARDAAVADPVAGRIAPGQRERVDRAGRLPTARIAGITPLRGEPDGSRSAGAEGWRPWSACLALGLAACGAVALTARRRVIRGVPVELQVVGRASLTPKHGIYVLKVGGRMLVVGAGPQGPPALLTELDEAPTPTRPTDAEVVT